jgi:hypothetical protein
LEIEIANLGAELIWWRFGFIWFRKKTRSTNDEVIVLSRLLVQKEHILTASRSQRAEDTNNPNRWAGFGFVNSPTEPARYVAGMPDVARF